MKINKSILIGAVLLVAVIGFTAFKNSANEGKMEYLTIYLEGGDFSEVHISVDGKDFRKMNMTAEYRSIKGFNPLINLIHDQEKDGWQLMGTPSYVPYGTAQKFGAGILVMMQRPAR